MKLDNEFAKYLSPNARIIHNQHFENAISKLQSVPPDVNLTALESEQVKRFEIVPIQQLDYNTLSIVARGEILKKPKRENILYRSVAHVIPTSNVAERLFSQARHIMNYDRKHMGSEKLDLLLFLKFNHSRWSINTIDLILRNNSNGLQFATQSTTLQTTLAPTPSTEEKTEQQNDSDNDESIYEDYEEENFSENFQYNSDQLTYISNNGDESNGDSEEN